MSILKIDYIMSRSTMAVLELNEQSNSFLRPTIVKPRLLFRSLGRSPFRHASKSGER